MSKISLIIADDHAIVREGICQLLESEDYIDIVGEASDGREAIELVREKQPDILIMDISMPNMTGIEAVGALVKEGVSTKVLMLSMFDKEEYVLKAVELGAYGYLMKDTSKDKFVKAINSIYNGQKYFSSEISNIIVGQYLNSVQNKKSKKEKELITRREKEILSAVVKGNNNKAIAEKYDLSIRTVETHRLNIMKKLGVSNAVELVKVAIDQKLVEGGEE
jgi:DNA-binding NarL/FixJ family response regulator